MALSGTSSVGMDAAESASASDLPEKVGAVSATTTVIFRLRAAALRKASTVCECPSVKIISLGIVADQPHVKVLRG